MRVLVLTVLLAACVPEPRPAAVTVTAGRERRASHQRSDRRLFRENRALRHEVRALREELAAARSAAAAEVEARRLERQQESTTAAELTQQIGLLSSTIGRLEKILQFEAPVAAQGRRQSGTFSKIRLGTVPAQTPTPPGPRPNMDAPAQWDSPPDLLNPFSKAPMPGVSDER